MPTVRPNRKKNTIETNIYTHKTKNVVFGRGGI